MHFQQNGIAKVAALIASMASIAVVALIWYALHYGDQRIWLAIALLMALSPFAMIWRLVRSDKSNHASVIKKPGGKSSSDQTTDNRD